MQIQLLLSVMERDILRDHHHHSGVTDHSLDYYYYFSILSSLEYTVAFYSLLNHYFHFKKWDQYSGKYNIKIYTGPLCMIA